MKIWVSPDVHTSIYTISTKRNGGETLIVGVYVDNLLITGTSIAVIDEFKQQMNDQFEVSNLEKLSY